MEDTPTQITKSSKPGVGVITPNTFDPPNFTQSDGNHDLGEDYVQNVCFSLDGCTSEYL